MQYYRHGDMVVFRCPVVYFNIIYEKKYTCSDNVWMTLQIVVKRPPGLIIYPNAYGKFRTWPNGNGSREEAPRTGGLR